MLLLFFPKQVTHLFFLFFKKKLRMPAVDAGKKEEPLNIFIIACQLRFFQKS